MQKKGVDISEHNGSVDFQALKNAGVQFAILRLGYGSDYVSQDDSRFSENVRKAETAGMPWGAYLYSYAGEQWKTAEKVRFIMSDFYTDQPDGIIGNEDCGQMSAWYVFSAMGFYPVNPVSGKYEIGTPLFPEMKLHLANGKTFTVLAPKVSKENIYIQSIKVDGQPYDKTYLTHEQIMSGATVEFEMGDIPRLAGVEFEEQTQ